MISELWQRQAACRCSSLLVNSRRASSTPPSICLPAAFADDDEAGGAFGDRPSTVRHAVGVT
jgi:hypothetical protein